MGLQEKFNVLALRNRFIPGWIRFILVMPGLVAGSYRWYSFTGLYRYLANLQLDVMGSYYVILTGLIMFFMLLLPAILVMFIVAPYYEHRVSQTKDVSLPTKTQDINILIQQRPGVFMAYLMSFLGTIGFGAVALYFFFMYGFIGSELIDLDAGELIHDDRSIIYVTFQGELDCDALYVMETQVNQVHSETAYVPVTNKDGTMNNTFLEATTYDGTFECVDGFDIIKGIMRPGGLPGMVRDAYLDEGVLNEDTEYMVVEEGARPDSMDGLIQAFAFCSAISLAIFLFIKFKKKPFA